MQHISAASKSAKELFIAFTTPYPQTTHPLITPIKDIANNISRIIVISLTPSYIPGYLVSIL